MKKKPRSRRSNTPAVRKSAAGTLPPGVLRVSPEPCRYYTESQLHGFLTRDPCAYVGSVKAALSAIAAGKARLTLPPKQVFKDAATRGDFRVMPCELREAGRVTKTVKLIGTNTVQRTVPDQITVGRLLVLDPEENYVSAVLEACLLSSARTGVCAALAIDALARSRDELVVIGSGRVGLYAAFYAIAAAGVKRVVLCDKLAQRARRAAEWLARVFPRARCEARPVSAIASADVVVLATTSNTPVTSPPAWDANLIVSLGADTDTQSELGPAWSRCADIYCDTLDSLRFGDLRAWTRAGLVDAAAVTDLLEIYRNPPPGTRRPRVFISTGSALFDNLTARYLIDSAFT